MSDQTLYIKPAPGRVIVMPHTRERLPADGAPVASSPYWLRRIADRDVIEVKPEAEAATKAPTAPHRKSRGESAADRSDA